MSVLDQGFTYCHLGLEIDAVYITLQASRYVLWFCLPAFVSINFHFHFITHCPAVILVYQGIYYTHWVLYLVSRYKPCIHPKLPPKDSWSCSYLGEEETAQYAKLYMWPFYYLGCLRNIAPNCKNGTFWIWLNDTWTSFMSTKS